MFIEECYVTTVKKRQKVDRLERELRPLRLHCTKLFIKCSLREDIALVIHGRSCFPLVLFQTSGSR